MQHNWTAVCLHLRVCICIGERLRLPFRVFLLLLLNCWIPNDGLFYLLSEALVDDYPTRYLRLQMHSVTIILWSRINGGEYAENSLCNKECIEPGYLVVRARLGIASQAATEIPCDRWTIRPTSQLFEYCTNYELRNYIGCWMPDGGDKFMRYGDFISYSLRHIIISFACFYFTRIATTILFDSQL